MPIRTVTIAGLAIAAVLTIQTIDLHVTDGRVPEAVEYDCGQYDFECQAELKQRSIERSAEVAQLEDEFANRTTLYAFAQIAIVLIALTLTLRAQSPSRWRRTFTDLGVAGVALGIATILAWRLSGIGSSGSGTVAAPVFAVLGPTGVTLLLAAGGGIASRLARWDRREVAYSAGPVPSPAPTAAPPPPQWLTTPVFGFPWPLFIAVAVTVLTVILAFIFNGPSRNCGGGGAEVPAWTDTVWILAVGTTIIAAVSGLVCLAMRRWVVALGSLVVPPSMLVIMQIADSCAFY